MEEKLIVCQGLSKHFGLRHALEQVDLEQGVRVHLIEGMRSDEN